VAYLTAPLALFQVTSTLLGDTVANRGADLLDLRSGKRGGNVEGGVDVTLEASESVGPGKTGRAAVEGLSLYLKGLSKLSHAFCKAVASLLVRAKMLYFAS